MRRQGLGGVIFGMFAATMLAGCDAAGQPMANAGPAAEAPVAISNPYLEAALRDVLPRRLPLVRLAGPGMCPGHFDIRPSQTSDLARCRLLLRFDFQQAFEEKVAGRARTKLRALAVKSPGGLCQPESYLSVCRQIADHFLSTGELGRREADERLSAVAQRAASLARRAADRIDAAGLREAPVVASRHQAAFCRWLGLRVAAAFSGADTAGTREIDEAVKAGEAAKAGVVIANEPEGRKLADALGDRLQAKVIVFANFPQPDTELAFDALVERNLAALLDAASDAAKRP